MIGLQLSQRLECPCVPGKCFASVSTLQKHKRSQKHQFWELCEENRQLRADVKAAENYCAKLEQTIQELISQPPRRRVTERVKKLVAAEQLWKCARCSDVLTSAYQVDHVTPLWQGGSNNRDNLAALCANCHAIKTQTELH